VHNYKTDHHLFQFVDRHPLQHNNLNKTNMLINMKDLQAYINKSIKTKAEVLNKINKLIEPLQLKKK
jgi:hypothetical protein